MTDTSHDDKEHNLRPPDRQGVKQYLPFLQWIHSYHSSNLLPDLLAGLFLGVLLIPQAMAYALLADLDPQIGLYASIVPAMAYAIFGNSRFLSIGPVALVSLLASETIAQTSAAHSLAPTAVALALALLAGLLLAIAGLLRLGFLVNFISDPVLTGFTSAAALLIATSQVKNLLGIDIPRDNFYQTWRHVISEIGTTNFTTLFIGGGALALILLTNGPIQQWLASKNIKKTAQTIITKTLPLILVIISTCLVWVLSLHQTQNVAVVGNLNSGLPPISLPPMDLALWTDLLPNAIAISAITYVTAVAIAKSLAGRRRQYIEPNQEAIALGIANIAAAFTGGYSVGGSISRSAINFDVGANTPMASVVGALLVLLATLILGPLFQFLPKAMLAALIISAVFGLFKYKAMLNIWRYSKAEGASLLTTFLGVLILGIESGIVLGAISGLALYLWRTSRPRIVIEGRLEDSQAFRNIERENVQEVNSPILVLPHRPKFVFCQCQLLRGASP